MKRYSFSKPILICSDLIKNTVFTLFEHRNWQSSKSEYPSNYYIFVSNISKQMIDLGRFLDKKSVNKAEISRRTGISPSRLSELSLKESTRLTADELYLIALAIDTEPSIVLEEVCKNLKFEVQ